MRLIPLTQDRWTIVDDELFPELSLHRWIAVRMEGHIWYAVTKLSGCRNLYMHRLVLRAQPGQEVDHINRNGLDNRRVNLRFCSHQQNQVNRRVTSNPHGFRGVRYDPRCPLNPWQARLTLNGKSISLGMYPTKEQAARAYDAGAREHFGPIFVANFPRQLEETIKRLEK